MQLLQVAECVFHNGQALGAHTILGANLHRHAVASHVDLREVLQTAEGGGVQLRNVVDGECEVGGVPWDATRDGCETFLGAVHHDRTAVAGQADVTREGFGVPSHGRRRVKTERPQAWHVETQQDEDASFLLNERVGGRWGVG